MFIISGDVFTEGGKDIAFSNYSASWKFHRKIAGKALRFFVIYYYINDILIICVDLKNIKTKFSCKIKKDYECLIYIWFYRHYLQGDLLEKMIQENMNKFLNKMAEEKEPFMFKEYVDLMVFHQLYTICFGEK